MMVFPLLDGFSHSFTVNLNFFGEVFMPRKRSKKVLYEVSSEVKNARKSGSRLEFFKRMRGFKKKVASTRKENKKLSSDSSPRRSKRGIFVFSGKLLNFSLKKALVLLVIFAVVVVLWPSGDKGDSVEPGGGTDIEMTENSGSGTESGGTDGETSSDGDGGSEVVPGPPKDHWIVVAYHTDLDQLKALSGHFALNGIKTEFKASGNGHILITKDRYTSPGDPQSGIEQAKTKIQAVGSIYKPDFSSGHLSFKFNDIYEDKE
jgi:hypothetical protein